MLNVVYCGDKNMLKNTFTQPRTKSPRKFFFTQIVYLSIIIGLTGCNYGHKNFKQENGLFNEPNEFVLQIDDFGQFWDPEIPVRALKSIKEVSKKKNTVVILFVHGWHHNAHIEDENAENYFFKSLEEIRKFHDDASSKQKRKLIGENEELEVIGLYVGWRGRSLPFTLNYTTFWGRKAAAERVGQGDLKEFLHRLNSIYEETNSERQIDSRYLGLVSIGHSFGGQVLFSAVRNTLEDNLIKFTSSISSNNIKELAKPLPGFGDMVVLINPAIESFQYDRIHNLNKRIKYSTEQTPLLLILSSESDFVRRKIFPIARKISAFFRPLFRQDQKQLWTQALGEYEPHRTHMLKKVSENKSSINNSCINYLDYPSRIIDCDLTNSFPDIRGIKMQPIKRNFKKFNPFLVVYVDDSIIIDHNKIFENNLRNFLNDYIAKSQVKRIFVDRTNQSSND